MNRVTLLGQLTADPEESTTAKGTKKMTFRLATNYSWKDSEGEWQNGVDFHRIVAWRTVAERASRLKKGDSVLVLGKLHTSSWVTDEGDKRFSTEVVVSSAVKVEQHKKESVDAEVEVIDIGEEPESAEE